jgi:hypothetical protein
MFIASARAVAGQNSETQLNEGLLCPTQTDILMTKIAIAIKVCEIKFS